MWLQLQGHQWERPWCWWMCVGVVCERFLSWFVVWVLFWEELKIEWRAPEMLTVIQMWYFTWDGYPGDCMAYELLITGSCYLTVIAHACNLLCRKRQCDWANSARVALCSRAEGITQFLLICVTFGAALRFVASIAENELMMIFVIKECKAHGACGIELVITLDADDCVELWWITADCVLANFAQVFLACEAEACCINASWLRRVWLIWGFFSFRKVIGEFFTTSRKDAEGILFFEGFE